MTNHDWNEFEKLPIWQILINTALEKVAEIAIICRADNSERKYTPSAKKTMVYIRKTWL